MLLAIDVGNTNTKFAFFEGDQIVNTFRLTTATPRTSDEFGMTIEGLTGRFGIGKKDIHGIIVSSVVPDIMHALNNSLYRFLAQSVCYIYRFYFTWKKAIDEVYTCCGTEFANQLCRA